MHYKSTRCMQSAYSSFVGKLEESARIHLRRQLEASTSSFTLHSLMHRMEQEGGGLADNSLYNNTMDLGGEDPADATNEDEEDDDEENGDPGAHYILSFSLLFGMSRRKLRCALQDSDSVQSTKLGCFCLNRRLY